MVVQPSKTFLLGNKSRDVSKKRKVPAEAWRALAQSLNRLPSFLPFSSHHLSPQWCEGSPLCVWLPLSVWRCVCVSVCGLGGFVAAECVVLFPAAMCLTYNEFVRQSVKITTTSKSFIREQILIISNPVTFQRSLENTNGIAMPYFRIETNKTTFMYLNLWI